jgi:probable rRNA maturation factor
MAVFLELDPTFAESPDLPDFNQVVFTVFKHQGIPIESDVTIALVDDDHIRKLNREFLGADKPTDVLAFPADHIDPDTNHRNIGDIVISYPRAVAQAISAGQPVSSELCLLTVHGLLHLLGFDHERPESKAEMWLVQSIIFNKMGIKIISPDYSTPQQMKR